MPPTKTIVIAFAKYYRQKLNNNFILYKIYFKYVLSSPTLLSRFIWTEDLYKHLSMINDMKEKHLENSVNMHVFPKNILVTKN